MQLHDHISPNHKQSEICKRTECKTDSLHFFSTVESKDRDQQQREQRHHRDRGQGTHAQTHPRCWQPCNHRLANKLCSYLHSASQTYLPCLSRPCLVASDVLCDGFSRMCSGTATRTLTLLQVRTDPNATEVDLLQPAFTRRREVFVGRLAMVGFVSAVFGEVIKQLSCMFLHHHHAFVICQNSEAVRTVCACKSHSMARAFSASETSGHSSTCVYM